MRVYFAAETICIYLLTAETEHYCHLPRPTFLFNFPLEKYYIIITFNTHYHNRAIIIIIIISRQN